MRSIAAKLIIAALVSLGPASCGEEPAFIPGMLGDISNPCDGSDPTVGTDKPELCDGKDNDCDGAVDEDFAWDGKLVGEACVGRGECGVGVVECLTTDTATCSTMPEGSQPGSSSEVCNGFDDDCDGITDEEASNAYFRDEDEDGYGDPAVPQSCSPQPGWVSVGGDCDDANAAVNPNADERCNGIDDDCDPATADGADDSWVGQACDGIDTGQCSMGLWSCTSGAAACVEQPE